METAQATPQGAPSTSVKTITLYVCPSQGCGNFFGHTSMLNLATEFTGPNMIERPNHEQMTGSPYRHSRAACPDCRARGLSVERVLVRLNVSVPLVGPETPALPTRMQ